MIVFQEEEEERDLFKKRELYSPDKEENLSRKVSEVQENLDIMESIRELFLNEVDRSNIHELLSEGQSLIEKMLEMPNSILELEKMDIENILYTIIEDSEPYEEEKLDDIIKKLVFIIEHIDITYNSAQALDILVNTYETIINDDDLTCFLLRLTEYECPLTEHIVMRVYNNTIESEDIEQLGDLWYILSWFIQDNIENNDTGIEFQRLLEQCICFLDKVQGRNDICEKVSKADTENIMSALDLLTILVKKLEVDYVQVIMTILGLNYRRLMDNTASICFKIFNVLNNLFAVNGFQIINGMEEQVIEYFKYLIDLESTDIIELLCPIVANLYACDNDTYVGLAHELYESLEEFDTENHEYPKTLAFLLLFDDIFNSD